jgi:fumarylacetoacetase
MLDELDHTHDPKRRSWVQSADQHPDFPLQNLPMGTYRTEGWPRIGVAIGSQILDLQAAYVQGALGHLHEATALAIRSETLNAWMALPAARRRELRLAIWGLLCEDTPQGNTGSRLAGAILRPQASAEMLLPAAVGDYSDFYAGIHHAVNCGLIFRPELPLQPNYKHLPVAYHGRSSTLRPSGTPVKRPAGQVRKDGASVTGPTEKMDFEMELAIWVGPGNTLGHSVGIASAADHVAGFGLLNDWSARDIQAWESPPLGPFLGKNFMTSLSPWVVTSDAMAPFRAPRMSRDPGDPVMQPYLANAEDGRAGGVDIDIEVSILTQRMRQAGQPAHRLSHVKATALFWTPAQMVAHHTVGGCELRAGDLIGSGTISMPGHQDCGCMLEMTEGGAKPVSLPSGEVRSFLHDGDEVIFRGYCAREGFARIGFGECRGVVQG